MFITLTLALPIAFASSSTDITLDSSTIDDATGLYVVSNFSVIYTESMVYSDYSGLDVNPSSNLNINKYDQISLQNAKVYFSIMKSNESEFTPIGVGTTDILSSMTLSDGTQGALYYGIAKLPVDSTFNNTCATLKAEFKGESDTPGKDYSVTEKMEQVCFGTPTSPAILSSIIISELSNPSNAFICAPVLILLVLVGGAFYYRGGQGMIYLFDFTSPRMPKLNDMKFKWAGYGWHGRFGDVTTYLADVKKMTKYTPNGKGIADIMKNYGKDNTMAGMLVAAKLAGVDISKYGKKSNAKDAYRKLQRDILSLNIDRDSKIAALNMMKTFRTTAEKYEHGKSHIRPQAGAHSGVVKGVIGSLQKGSLMSTLLAPMQYSAKVAKGIAPGSKAAEKVGEFLEGKMKAMRGGKEVNIGMYSEADDKSKVGPSVTEKMFRMLHEPLAQYLGRLNAGQYIIRPIFATYFTFLPNIGKWKDEIRKQSWAREIIGLSAKDRGDVIGRLSNELRRNLSLDKSGKLSLLEGGNTDRIAEAYDRESAGLLLKGMMDKILKDEKMAKKLNMTRDELAMLNALKGTDLSNFKGPERAGLLLKGMMDKILKDEKMAKELNMTKNDLTILNALKGVSMSVSNLKIASMQLKGTIDRILKEDKIAKEFKMTNDDLAILNALKRGDLSNFMDIKSNIEVLRTVMNKMDAYDKGNRMLLQKISGVINASESGMSLAEKHKKYRDIAAEVYGKTGKTYEYFLNRCRVIDKGYREMNDEQLYGSTIKKSIVVWKLNNSLDDLAKSYGVDRSVFNARIRDSTDASKNILADMFYSLAKVNKGNASLSDALGLVYLQKINNMYGFLPANKDEIKAILSRANESSVGHLPKKQKESLLIAPKDIDAMAGNLAAAMQFGNEIAKKMIDRNKIPDDLKYLVRDGNYLIFFNGRALKEEIDNSKKLDKAQKDALVNNFVFGEGFKDGKPLADKSKIGEGYQDVVKADLKNYVFGTGARHEPHTYLTGSHWAYIRGNEDPFKLLASGVPTSKRFGDLADGTGETEMTLKFVGLWDVFYRREKGMFKKSGGTPESALNAMLAQVVAKGSENDDRLFTLISDRTTTLQSRNTLTFGTRYIHTLDYLLSTMPAIDYDAAIRKEGRDPTRMSNAEYEKTKARIFDKAVWAQISDQDKRLVTLTQLKKTKDFIFMNGELGDLIPLRVNLDSMNPEIKSMLFRDLSSVKDLDTNSLSFQSMMRASTEKALNMRISYIGEHGNVYRSMIDLADSYRVTDKEVRQFLRDLASNKGKDALGSSLANIISTVSDPQQVAIAAFRYGEKMKDYQPLLGLANVKVGTVADIDQQRMEAWKNVYRSGNPIEALSGMLLYGKETAIDSFAKFHESVLYKKTLQIGNEDLFGIENQESRILKESFAVADEYGSLNKILARMERGADQNDIAFLRQFSENGVFDKKAAEIFIISRLGDLKRSYDAYEWFMTRDVHPIYGGTFPYYRDGLVSASFNAGLSTLKPSWIDQMITSFRRENLENYPTGVNWALNWAARETIHANLPLQQAFVHAVRFEDKMTRGIPNPYEIRYEGDGDVKRTLASMGISPVLHGRLVEPGTISGPSDQFMQSQGINVGYTLSGLATSLGFSGSKVGWAGAAALVGGPLSVIGLPAVFYAGKFANDAIRDGSRAVGNFKTDSDTSEGIDLWKRLGGDTAWSWSKKRMEPVGNWIASMNPNEGSAIADKEETHLARRVSSHFYWYSNEFGTPADIPGREHFQWGTGRHVVEPAQQWKVYNLYEFKTQEWKQNQDTGRFQWEFKEPKTSSVNMADKDDLAYASLSIRKRHTTIVDDYFKREQELSYYSPSRHMMGVMINPLIATNFLSSTVERGLNNIYDSARDAIEEEGPIDPQTGRPASAPRRLAKKVGGATANFFSTTLSAPLNIAAVTLGGTNYMMKCSQCGSFVRRGASSCPQCRVRYD